MGANDYQSLKKKLMLVPKILWAVSFIYSCMMFFSGYLFTSSRLDLSNLFYLDIYGFVFFGASLALLLVITLGKSMLQKMWPQANFQIYKTQFRFYILQISLLFIISIISGFNAISIKNGNTAIPFLVILIIGYIKTFPLAEKFSWSSEDLKNISVEKENAKEFKIPKSFKILGGFSILLALVDGGIAGWYGAMNLKNIQIQNNFFAQYGSFFGRSQYPLFFLGAACFSYRWILKTGNKLFFRIAVLGAFLILFFNIRGFISSTNQNSKNCALSCEQMKQNDELQEGMSVDQCIEVMCN